MRKLRVPVVVGLAIILGLGALGVGPFGLVGLLAVVAVLGLMMGSTFAFSPILGWGLSIAAAALILFADKQHGTGLVDFVNQTGHPRLVLGAFAGCLLGTYLWCRRLRVD
jgi:uncharacterized protein (DUF697 family)